MIGLYVLIQCHFLPKNNLLIAAINCLYLSWDTPMGIYRGLSNFSTKEFM